jgi:hypothetical protein
LDISVPPTERVRFGVDCGEDAAKANACIRRAKGRKKGQKPVIFDRDIYITFEYTDKKTGNLIAREQIAVEEKSPSLQKNGEETPSVFQRSGRGLAVFLKNGEENPAAPKKSANGRLEIVGEKDEIVVGFEGGFAAIGKKSGNLERLNYGGKELKKGGIDGGKGAENDKIYALNGLKTDEINAVSLEKGLKDGKNNAEKELKKDGIDDGKSAENDKNGEENAENVKKNGEVNGLKDGEVNAEKGGRGECCRGGGSCADGGVFSERPWDGLTGIYDCLFRAPIDNDRNVAPQMTKLGYDSLKPYVKSIKSGFSTDGGAAVEVEKYLLNAKGQALFRVKTVYAVSEDGRVGVRIGLKKRVFKKLPILSRVGVNFELCGRLKNVGYFGRGERESLPDFNEHAPVGVYRFEVKDAHEPYIKPQDNNRRTDVLWAEFTGDDGKGIRIEADGKRFSFAAHDYTDRAVAAAAHDEEIERSGTTFVSLDGYTMGAGSNSCGPLPEEKFLLRADGEYEYGFVITRI